MASKGDGNRRIQGLIDTTFRELIGNLKVYEVVFEKNSKASKVKKEKYKSLALKARKVSSDEEESRLGSDEEYFIVITTGSILVTPGSVLVITTGSILVTPGSVLVTPGSVVVTPGSYSYYYW
ncbi:hypothetical protein Tco_0609208 [Tanacetum coccineum]